MCPGCPIAGIDAGPSAGKRTQQLEKNTYLPVHNLDEDGDVDGEA